MTTMRVWTDGTDTVVAADAADAAAVLAEYHGEGHAVILRPVDPDKEIAIHEDVDTLRYGEECPQCGFALATSRNGHHRGCPVGCPVKTAAQWAAENGRGFLCSTEY